MGLEPLVSSRDEVKSVLVTGSPGFVAVCDPSSVICVSGGLYEEDPGSS